MITDLREESPKQGALAGKHGGRMKSFWQITTQGDDGLVAFQQAP